MNVEKLVTDFVKKMKPFSLLVGLVLICSSAVLIVEADDDEEQEEADCDANPDDCPPPDIHMKPMKMFDCGDDKSYIKLHDLKIVREAKNEYSMDAGLTVEKIWERNITVVLQVWKCSDEANPDTCEDFVTREYKTFCDVIGREGQLWTEIVKKVQDLSMQCPIEPGEYKVDHPIIKIDDKTARMPIMNGYFMARVTYREDPDVNTPGEAAGCFQVEVKVYQT